MRPTAHAVAAALALMASAWGSGALAAGPEGVRLLETSAVGTRFEVTLPPLVLTPLGAGAAGAAMRVDLEGCSTSEDAGAPALPVRMLSVAVPPTGDVHVSGVGLEASVHEGVDVAYVPLLGSGAAAATPPAACARLLDVGWMRHQRIARIELRPASYDAAARRLAVFGRIDVTVDVEATPAASAAPDSDAFEPLYRQLVVNYVQGRGWRSRHGAESARSPGRTKLDAVAAAATIPDTSVFIGRRWVKIGIRQTGFYRLPYSRFKSFAPFSNDTTIAADSLRLFTWSGLPILPEASFCDTCGYHEVALGIVDDDGRMNHANDAIYFYALGPSDWADRFDARQADTVFVNHPYETRNYYYLGVSTAAQPLPGARRRIGSRSGTPTGGGAPTPLGFPARVHQEQDNQYDANQFPYGSTYTWDKFFWAFIEAGGSVTASIDAPGADTTQGGRVRSRIWSEQVTQCAGCPDCTDERQVVQLGWNGRPAGAGTFGWNGVLGYTVDTPVDSVRRRGNACVLTVSYLGCKNEVFLSWFDLFYGRRFEPVAEKLEFRPPRGGGDLLYRVGPFQGTIPPRVFDISDPVAPVEITGATYAPASGGQQLSFESADDDTRRYSVLPDTSFAAVGSTDLASAAGTSIDNLRSHTQQADYVVIYFDDFQAAADTLALWRRLHNGFRTKAVPISAIYDQYSGGRTDPTAIRNFLRSAFYNWQQPPPAYVTFLGDASYDFKNIRGLASGGQPGCLLPTFENSFDPSPQSLRQYTTDDWLLNVDSPTVVIPDFLGGRLPVGDAATAMNVVRNKLLRYERAAPAGSFRDRVMLIADDSEQGNIADPLQWTHLLQTTTLDSKYTPNCLDRDYVYLHTFPTTTSYTKPAARDSILFGLDGEGVTLMNYIGHGSPIKLSDETVMVVNDADGLTNLDRLPLLIAASCDVGRFSDPTLSSLGEHMITAASGGGIGVISATDLAFSGQNEALNDDIYGSLLGRNAGGELSGQVSQALLLAKLNAAAGFSGTNAQKYTLMGDAALRLNLPRYWVDVSLKDDHNADTTAIQQGRRMTFSGRVLNEPNGTPVAIDGTADVLVEDSQPLLQAPNCVHLDCSRPFYLYKAGPIFRGTAAVHAGVVSGEFVVPLEASPGTRGRVRVYLAGQSAGGASSDGAGDLKVRVATGVAPAGDTQGPAIRLSFPNGATRVRPDAVLRIDLADTSGILITGHTPQNGIVVTIDGNSNTRVEVTDGFHYNEGSFQAGTVSFPLPQNPSLADGLHTISVSAADNLAAGLASAEHRSRATLQFEVRQAPPLRIVDTYLFPDPTSSTGGYSGGQFVVDTEGGAMDLQLRIFSVSGRLLRRLDAHGVEGQVQVPWDGLDAEGQGLANGVYLFKVVVASASGTAVAGLSLHDDRQGRFVIVNP